MKGVRRVLITADAMGGVWTYALELMRALPDVEFAVCTMGAPPSTCQRQEIVWLKNAALFVSPYKLEWMDNPWSEVDAAGEWLLEIAADFGPDLIHLNGYAHAALPWTVPVMVVAHSCVVSWWRAVKNEDPPAAFDQYRDRVTRGLGAANLVVAPSRAMLDSLHENYPARVESRVIYNGRDSSHLFSAEKLSHVFAAGRVWDEGKNLRTLDRVAPHISWPIEIAGDLTDPRGGQVLLRNARALGRLSTTELSQKLAISSIFAFPARYEPFGFAVLEAALSGCALVLGNIPSLREIWSESAVFVDPNDQAALASSLDELIANEALLGDFSRRAEKRAGEFSLQKMAADYRAAYASCLCLELREAAA